MIEIQLGWLIFFLGLALFVGGFLGMLTMSLFCSSLRAERDAWRQKYLKAQGKYQLLLDDFKKQMSK